MCPQHETTTDTQLQALQSEVALLRRESQIEAALERIRASAMAMHKSQDIMLVAEELRTQMSLLGQPDLESCIIHIYPEGQDHFVGWWVYESTRGKTKKMVKGRGVVPYKSSLWSTEVRKQYQSSKSEYTIKSSGKMLREWYGILKEMAPETVEYDAKDKLIIPEVLYYHFSKFSGGALLAISEHPPSEETKSLQDRAASVFGLAHRRFLDLQKAEAQAKEAQIEAALEKVRSSSLSMDNTSDLQNVVNSVFVEMNKLDIGMDHTAIVTLIDGSKDYNVCVGSRDATFTTFSRIPFNDWTQVQRDYNDMIAKRPSVLVKTYQGSVKREYSQYLFSQTGFKNNTPEKELRLMMDGDSLITSIVMLKNSGIQLVNYQEEEFTDADNEILKRFTIVLEQAYIRFLDIQKAETQAREAQIEVSLERVRASSLAMHTTTELQGVIFQVFQQLNLLGIEMDVSFLEIFDDSNDTNIWVANPKHDHAQLIHIPYRKNPIMDRMLEARKNREEYFTDDYSKRDKNNFYRYAFKYSEMKKIPKTYQEDILARSGYTRSVAMSEHAALAFFNLDNKPYKQEDNDLLNRFSKVFNQAYSRFLDLQKAEAQAKEAQIETALERIRAASMAMHDSDDLIKVSAVVRKQMIDLGQKEMEAIVFHLYNDSKDEFNGWFVYRHPDNLTGPLIEGICKIDWSKTERARKDKEMYLSDQKDYTITGNYKMLQEWYEYLEEIGLHSSNEYTEQGDIIVPNQLFYNYSKFTNGAILLITSKEADQDSKNLLKRTAKAFNMAYLRFLDLQKAEAQAREAQIEAALERIRASAMAMHSSEGLLAVSHELRAQLNHLEVQDIESMVVVTYSLERNKFIADYVYRHADDTEGPLRDGKGVYDWTATERARLDKEKYFSKETDYTIEANHKILLEWYQYMEKITPNTVDYDDKGKLLVPDQLFYNSSKFNGGSLLLITNSGINEQTRYILKRAAKVFDLAYQRYLDIQRAEAQAREALIEVALERVRAKGMAMQHSDELNRIVAMLAEEFANLDILLARCILWIINPQNMSARMWMSNSEAETAESYYIPKLNHKYYTAVIRAWKERNTQWIYELKGAEKESIDNILLIDTELSRLPGPVKKGILASKRTIVSGSFHDFGMIEVSGSEQLITEHLNILHRFGKVFDQTYRRFLDLQKAEAQAREARIEAALERVRASSMAMHSSDGLLEVTHVLREQLASLGEEEIESTIIHLYEKDAPTFKVWYTYINPDDPDSNIIDGEVVLEWDKTDRTRVDVEKFYSSETDYTIVGDKKMLREWYKYMYEVNTGTVDFDENGEMIVPDVLYYNYSKFSVGALLLITSEEASDNAKHLLKRAAKVFNQAYTRFLDLQKAEARAREAKIEVSLERIRARAMAMHQSEDLSQAVDIVFQELETLDLSMIRCGIGIIDAATRNVDLWTTSTASKHGYAQVTGDEPLEGHPLLNQIFENFQTQTDFTYVLQGDDLHAYNDVLANTNYHLPDRIISSSLAEYYHSAFFEAGGLYVYTDEPFTEEAINIIRKFADVFHLTYTRYQDLQKAEAQTREAQIEAALERVRSASMAMHSSDGLLEVTNVLRQQMALLGEDELESILIHNYDESKDTFEAWYTYLQQDGEDRKLINDSAVLNWVNTARARMDRQLFLSDKSDYTIIADHKMLKEWYHYIHSVDTGVVEVDKSGNIIVPDSLYYNYSKFSAGALLLVTNDEASEQSKHLLHRAAEVFNMAYTRFLDLKKAEAQAAKAEAQNRQLEQSYENLKATQTQLVQAEKMASLGELTAGIAHEIQNPLNFVNNFSDVNAELIDELIEEITSTRPTPKAIADGSPINDKFDSIIDLANDIKANEEKIMHHGKRADSIVKGMLQHSRIDAGEKVPTDINALCDEFLRLSYHGLRAKDKSFNSGFETHFDETLPRINVIPQDLGRVLLNILNNAFYAVAERSRSAVKERADSPLGAGGANEEYKPLVTLTTQSRRRASSRTSAELQQLNGSTAITIKDNGIGMSQETIDKVFQPFFTTKPTGSGTGLGMSISYDIITKGHGGELKVESEEGEGSIFTIMIPR